jgi:DNA polymerase I
VVIVPKIMKSLLRGTIKLLRHVAVNSPIQGTAADSIKLVMLAFNRKLKEENLTMRILLQVHDELMLEAPEQEVTRCVEIMKQVMEDVTECGIPLRVNC